MTLGSMMSYKLPGLEFDKVVYSSKDLKIWPFESMETVRIENHLGMDRMGFACLTNFASERC
jgi:hypothetical protein